MTFLIRQLLCLTLLVPASLVAENYQIAFGSCYEQSNPNLPIWQAINKHSPDLFIFMGDNVYIDSDDPAKFTTDYKTMLSNPGIKELQKNTQIMATWDDHDYGLNDGGKEFTAKELAKAAFVDAFNYSEINNIPEGQGIYHSRTIEIADKSIQVILLDTRWYRDPLLKNQLSEQTRERFELGNYRPHLDESTTLLGEQQWQWLEKQLKQPVDLNIIVSSIQFLAENTAWEIWANFPHERKRLLELINQHSAGKAVVLSGDVHRAEFSSMPVADWTLYEVTSSGLSAKIYPGKPNIHLLGEAIAEFNYGLLDIHVDEGQLSVKAGIYNNNGEPLSERLIPLSNQE